MRGKVILEEAWNLPRLANEAANYASPEGARKLEKAIQDINGRVKEMDENGIQVQILSFTSPGAQACSSAAEGEALAREANDWVYEQCKQNPSRFANLGAVCMIRPEEAAKEAKRCFEELNFVGVILNDFQSVSDEEAPDFAEPSEVDGMRIYYDSKSYDVFWKVLEDAGRPCYIHPRLLKGEFFKRRPWLSASTHGFKVQTSFMILALITGGVFDRFPKLQLMFGHMGEGITADLWRVDHRLDRSRFPTLKMDKQKMIRDYFMDNIHITTSGHYSTRMLQAAMAELGADRIQFAIDYPYEDDLKNWSDWIDSCPISEPDRIKIARNNAVKLLRLDQAPWNMSLEASRKELGIGGMTSHVWGYGLSQH